MPPIIVNKPVRMKRINLVVPKTMVDQVIGILQEHGTIHIEEIGERVEEYKAIYEKSNKLIEIINNILSRVKGTAIDVKITRQELESLDLKYIEKEVTSLYNEIEGLKDKKHDLEEKIRYLKELYETLIHVPSTLNISVLCFRGKYLSSITIRGRTDRVEQFFEAFKEIHIIYRVTYEQFSVAIILFPTNTWDKVFEKINSLGLYVFKPAETTNIEKQSVGEYLKLLESKIEEYRNIIQENEEKINTKIRSSINDLGKYLLILENHVDRLKTLLATYNSKYLTMIRGWIPSKQVDNVLKALKEKGIVLYYEIHDPVKGVDEPPTLLENPPVLRWYEPIVKFIGMPRYWEWDPTPIIAYSFALFFGIMLGDMGYAIAIILAAIFVLDKFVADPSNRDYVFFKRSLILSSAVGFAVGFTSGSLFGIPFFQLIGLPTITRVFIDPISFLVVAIIIGLIHVNISHGLALVKSIKEKSWGEVLSETGLFISEVFGIPYIMKTMLHTPVSGIPEWFYPYLLYGAFAGVILIIIGMVKSIGGLGLLMWLFNLTGLLGDVLSYSRLAGVGLATVFLGQSFNQIAMLAYNGLSSMMPNEVAGTIVGGLVVSIILFFGHLLNTALSALGGFIHSLRLCFVEFLSKFYEGTGYAFEPLKIVLRRKLVIE